MKEGTKVKGLPVETGTQITRPLVLCLMTVDFFMT